jgi:hypothetical protein
MTEDEQKKVRLDLEFIGYGVVNAKLYFFNDDKKKRLFINPVKGGSTELVYGGIFKLNDYAVNEHKLHSYYNSSVPFTGYSFLEDIFIPQTIEVKPILFTSLKEIELCTYQRLQGIECLCFVGNPQNKKVKNSIKRGRYYRIRSVDARSFIRLVGEKNG